MQVTKEDFKQLDQELKLISLSYDRAFKINLDVLKVTIPLNINEYDNINLLDSEISITNKKEYKRTVDILVVINMSKDEFIIKEKID